MVALFYDDKVICFQVICDADLKFINVVARWPGSVHDARILRNCLVCCL